MDAMNEKSVPTEGERKGGSGHVGKIIFSAGVEYLAIAAYVPEDKQDERNCEMMAIAKDVCIAKIMKNSDKNVFLFKIGKGHILEANNQLKIDVVDLTVVG
eukprot:3584431-Heterocapsa_arctica.AAC.1